jgi:hypothetical protein
MSLAASNVVHTYPRARRLLIDFAFTCVFNLGIAVVITYVMRIGYPFGKTLVFAMCIGTLALLFIDGGRLLLWGDCKPPKIPYFTLWVISIPAAQLLGNMMATRILGLSEKSVTITYSQNPIGMLLISIMACVFITWFFWNRGKLEHLKAEAESEKARTAAIEKQAMQAQLQLLQAQIEPHMLFNTLANLKGLIALDGPRAQHMLDQLIQYLRAALTSSRAQQTTLDDEFSLMEAYLGLMSIRMGSRLSYALQLPEALRAAPIPPMLLQPLVENAIKHGLEPKIDGGRIEVRASLEGDNLTLTVTDTGLGLEPPTACGTHLGLANIGERLRALYGERASCTLAPNTPTGAIARLIVPL